MSDVDGGRVPGGTERWALAAPGAVALGHVVALLVPPGDLSLPALALMEGGLALVLVSSLLYGGAPGRVVVAFLAVLAGLVATAVGGPRATPRLWLVALAVGLAVATLSYALHRYELVRLGLVAVEPAGE